MRKITVVFNLCVLFFLLSLFPSASKAQGCGEYVEIGQEVSCCGGLYLQPDSSCRSGGNPTDFCYEGYGECCGASYSSATITPSACSSCDPSGDGADACASNGGLWHPSNCTCSYKSPIIVDVAGNGFRLTSASRGVQFQFGPSGGRSTTAWTAPGSDGDAFLVLDRNNNGVIDNGAELFGNFTPQPNSDHPNGFLALAEYDKPENGGNGDGIIDHQDAIFQKLRLWVDANHDGISQPEELHTLPDLGVFSLGIHYRESRHEDQSGNAFRYIAAVNPDPRDGESKDGRWAYDVFFVSTDAHAENHSLDERMSFGVERLNPSPRATRCKQPIAGGIK